LSSQRRFENRWPPKVQMRGESGAEVPVERLRPGDPSWPAMAFDGLREPVAGLYAMGRTRLLERTPRRSVAIVGTRDASPYGMRVADELARAFVRAGITVVSGLARGIDSAAHRGALGANGDTVAVLGTGVDVPYPVGHRELHGHVSTAGLVVSEREPGCRATPGCFPRRNRIIAALAEVTVVVEAPYKSGAVNTATQALELGRVVAAVPGPIDSARSAGSNLLLRDGAQVITGVSDALGLFGVAGDVTDREPNLGYEEGRVWEALEGGEASAESLSARLGMSIRQVLELASRLEISGLVEARSDGVLSRRSALST
jgi:DNA processing protein